MDCLGEVGSVAERANAFALFTLLQVHLAGQPISS